MAFRPSGLQNGYVGGSSSSLFIYSILSTPTDPLSHGAFAFPSYSWKGYLFRARSSSSKLLAHNLLPSTLPTSFCLQEFLFARSEANRDHCDFAIDGLFLGITNSLESARMNPLSLVLLLIFTEEKSIGILYTWRSPILADSFDLWQFSLTRSEGNWE